MSPPTFAKTAKVGQPRIFAGEGARATQGMLASFARWKAEGGCPHVNPF
jgi:hypothetical protein